MNAEDILTNTDPKELRNIIHRLRLDSDASRRAVASVLINQNPNLFPPPSSGSNFDIGWINVKDHGAIGDGASDDTASINNAIATLNTAGRGVLYFPPGTYLCSSGLTAITAATLILGCGMDAYDNTQEVSKLECTSATATLFTINSKYAKFLDIVIGNNNGAVSAGAGILVTSSYLAQRVDYYNVNIGGFYINIDVQVGNQWVMEGCYFESAQLYALKIRNTVNPDAGDWSISNTTFVCSAYNSTAAIRIESSGGGKITNCKINAAPGGIRYDYGIDVAGTGSTSILLISNTSIENIDTNCIRSVGDWLYIVITGVQCALYTANNTSAILLNGMDYFAISNCVLVGPTSGSSSAAAIGLTSCTYGFIGGLRTLRFTGDVAQTTCTNIIDASSGMASNIHTATADTPLAADEFGFWDAVDLVLKKITWANIIATLKTYFDTLYSALGHSHSAPDASAVTYTPADNTDWTGSADPGDVDNALDQLADRLTIAEAGGGGSTGSGGHLHGLARWLSSGGTTFNLPDIAEYIESVSLNGLEEDPTLYSLSSDRTQIVFDSATTAADVVTAQYVLAQV